MTTKNRPTRSEDADHAAGTVTDHGTDLSELGDGVMEKVTCRDAPRHKIPPQ